MSEEAGLTPRRIALSAEHRGRRLDQVLAELLGVSRTRVQELIRDGGVRLDGEPAPRPSQRIEDARELEILSVPRARERRGAPAGASFEVLFEDEHLVAIDKPPGMVSHPSSVVRGSTVSELATERWGVLPALQGADRPGIVHRLDAETSGVMLIARSAPAAHGLLAAFRERRVAKTYLALVFGEPRFDSDWITAPVGRAPGRPDRMSVLEEGEGLDAETFYETRERLAGHALVAARPRTGRTHQIRVHLASIGLPLIGERVYRARGGAAPVLPRGAPDPGRHALHAASLELTHPISGAPLRFEAPLWPDLARLLDWLRERAERLAAGEAEN